MLLCEEEGTESVPSHVDPALICAYPCCQGMSSAQPEDRTESTASSDSPGQRAHPPQPPPWHVCLQGHTAPVTDAPCQLWPAQVRQ